MFNVYKNAKNGILISIDCLIRVIRYGLRQYKNKCSMQRKIYKRGNTMSVKKKTGKTKGILARLLIPITTIVSTMAILILISIGVN